jgi:1A family penicillin-binding protein
MYYVLLYRIKRAVRFFSEPFFFVVYLVIQAMVFIGDSTRRIILSPYTFIRWLIGVSRDIRPRLQTNTLTSRSFKIDLLKVRNALGINYTSVESMLQKGRNGYRADRLWLTGVISAGIRRLQAVKLTFPRVTLPEISIPRIRLPRIEIRVPAFPRISIPWTSWADRYTSGSQKPPAESTPRKNKGKPRLAPLFALMLAALMIWSRAITLSIGRFASGLSARITSMTATFRATGRVVHELYATAGRAFRTLGVSIGSFFKTIFRFFTSHKLRYFVAGLASCFVIVFVWQSYAFVKALPSPRNIGKLNYPTSTHIYDRNGKLLYEIFREENRTPVPMTQLPESIRYATIATEDREFYTHKGVSIVNGMLRALRDTYITQELQGGSTITQQLVKSSLLSPERTIERKVKEVILALWTERLYSKDQILEMYLNQVPYGGSAYGVEEASKQYFGKSAKDLRLEEAAFLAGLPQAPSLYSPYLNPERAKRRRNEVLRLMFQERYITKKQYDDAVKKSLTVVPPTVDIKAPHFVFYTKRLLEERYGATVVEEGGLRVTTTLDLDVQEAAEQILKEEIAKVSHLNINNGAVLVTKPKTGEIVAMVGSLDYYASPSGAFNVTTALRQPGSTVKALTYSLALENGFTAATLIDDQPLSIQIPGAEPYTPVNYDGRYHGRVPMRVALANSYNIPAVKVLQTLGVQRFLYHAEKLGIDTWQDKNRFGLSITLGGGEVRMTDLAEAFGVFASQGYQTPLTGIKEIENLHGDPLEYETQASREVMDGGVAYIISDILSDNVARQAAFGSGSQLEIPGYKVAVKTGTTNELKDNWTIGYTPEYLVTVWVGNNDNTPMNQYLVSGITGAAPIWNRTMTYLLTRDNANGPNEWFEMPSNVVARPCYGGRTEYFLAGTESSSFCGPLNTGRPWQNGGQLQGQNQGQQWQGQGFQGGIMR